MANVTFQDLIASGHLEIGDGYRAKNSELGGDGPIFLRAGHLTDAGFDFENVERLRSSLASSIEGKMAKPGDTVVTTKGNSTGRVGYVEPDFPGFVYSPHLSYWRSKKPADLLPGFVRYWSRGREFRDQLQAMKTSTDMAPYLSLTDQRRLRITLPDPRSQKAIGSALTTLDDKIAQNVRVNRSLDSLAAALFNSWFMDFDPVIARRDGKTPVGVPADAIDLFPSHFEESKLGPIPKGWTAASVGERFDVAMGQSPPGSTYNERGDGLPFYQGRTDFGFRYPGRRVYCTGPSRFAEAGDTLISVRAPVGDVNMASERCAIGRGVAAVRHRDGKSSFTYYAMHSLRQEFNVYEAEGTLFGAIGGDDLRRLPFVHPSDPILKAFEALIRPLDTQIESNERESRTLAELRDTLLGPLLSGELTIKRAEKAVGEAI